MESPRSAFDRLVGILRDRIGNHRFERAIEKHLNEAVRCVVAPGRLARVSLRLTGLSEGEYASLLRDLRLQLQQALVDASEFLGTHVTPVHSNHSGRLLQPGETVHGGEERAILQPRAVKVWALIGCEESSKRRQAEPGFPARQTPKDDGRGRPQVRKAVVGVPLE